MNLRGRDNCKVDEILRNPLTVQTHGYLIPDMRL